MSDRTGTLPSPAATPGAAVPPDVFRAAAEETGPLLDGLGVRPDTGLDPERVRALQERYGPNAVSSHRARVLPVIWHQLRSPLLGLLLVAAAASSFLGERNDAVVIGVIVLLSVGLGFVNEYRAERAAEALHSQIAHQATAIRGGGPVSVDVTALVPGDIVELSLGEIVPADLRLIEVSGLECDESMLTGESEPVTKTTAAVRPGSAIAELTGCALMGTVVHAGSGLGVVVATGAAAQFGKIAVGLTRRQLETAFQLGLRRFSMLLVYVAAALTTSIFVINVALHRPVMDALLFSLAIAVGITPQLLPAVVSTSLAAGSRRMGRRKVLVKRLVCIEDLGDVDTLFTDKTGTLTLGRVDYARAVPCGAARPADVVTWGLVCTETLPTAGPTVGGNALDRALWNSPAGAQLHARATAYRRLGVLPFDHDRRMVSVLAGDDADRLTIVTKGAPEEVLDRCVAVPEEARRALEAEFRAGNRVIAVATRTTTSTTLQPSDERQLELAGFLVFHDPPKPDAASALLRLAGLGITVKVVTGDNPAVAVRVCTDLGLDAGTVVTGTDLDALGDDDLPATIAAASVFARVSPEQKARIVRAQRHAAGGVAFLGDGVNDALALHAADVGISVDSGTDVAKDAADVILLEKDLDVLADGVTEGRRVFANTIKYVLMGTSSNFGNMASAAGASIVLPFLPMLPSQILLNNLLYDTSQLAIPTDDVDEQQLVRPSHWDIGFIRRFMLVFGPLSSLFDFATFAVMIWVFHAGHAEFRTGWFVESLATQTLVVFAIRTRRIPFFRSHPSLPLTLATLAVVTTGALLPASPLASVLGLRALPQGFFVALAAMVVVYLALIEGLKGWFYRSFLPTGPAGPAGVARPTVPAVAGRATHRHLARRARRFTVSSRLGGSK